MSDETPAVRPELQYVAAIVAAYLSNNHLPTVEIPNLIRSVHGAFVGLTSGAPVEAANLKPAVPIRKSVTPDYIVCLEDGKRLKMLKRYLRSRYKLTPEEYRARWSLPLDYPMVAPEYAELRSQHAKKIGLGKTPHKKESAKRKRG